MPFARPTKAELVDRIRSDLRGRLEVDGPLLRRAMIDILAIVWAGAVHLLYGFLDWLSRQLFGTTADREALLVKAAEFGIVPIAATYASGNLTATGVNGTAIPINTILKLDDATSYRVTAGQVIAGGTATLPVTAVLAGEIANIATGTALTFESPIAGVNSIATVDAPGLAGGNDEERTEALRVRYLERLREPPEGGADPDYVAWAKKVAGVTRAWTYPTELGLGTVVVRFVRDLDGPLPADIFPDAGEVAAVQASENAERPITAAVTAVAPVDLPVAPTLHIVPDNADTRAAVEAELADLFKREAEPGDGAGRGTIKLSHIRTAIGIAAGVTDYTLTLPAADVVPALGELATLDAGSITWV